VFYNKLKEMINLDLLKELIEKINSKADDETCTDDNEDFNAMDASGGNFDDAYDLGCEDGEVWFARELQYIIEKYNK